MTREPETTKRPRSGQPEPAAARAAGRAVLRADPAAVSEARRRVRESLGRARVPSSRLAETLLLVSELVTNGIRHGSRPGDEIELSWQVDGGSVQVAVRDCARGGGATRQPMPSADRPSGRGLRIVEALADDWCERIVDGRREVAFRLAL